ncbi:MAG: ATP-binding protein [Methanoregula sp.]|jgi:PAS domain S-box-containing protein|uniref:ATP-binding protein n=1 Tax=Methanoregula sp. TaxID=2052170 RepID=UPI003D12ED37
MIAHPALKKRLYQSMAVLGILLTTLVAIGSTVYCLTHGIYDIFPFLYFMPLIIFVYFYPQRGVLFSLFISTVYLLLVYSFSNFDPSLLAVSTAWFVIFVTIGVVTSSFAEELRAEEKKYRRIFENSQAGIFTFDLVTLRIGEINAKCARMLKYETDELTGRDISRILPGSAGRDSFIEKIRENMLSGDVELLFQTRDGEVRQFLVSASLGEGSAVICSAIDITDRRLAEKVIQKARYDLEQRVTERTEELLKANSILKAEIQERKRFENAIQLANRKLSTLSAITRHDILNQITAIVMYLSLAEDTITDPGAIEYLRKTGYIIQLIQKQIRFTRDYQTIGARPPRWQSLHEVVWRAIQNIDPGRVRVEKDLGIAEIYSDYLFAKVFVNLVDNSLRHGGNVTVCRFLFQETGSGAEIVYEDNGIGIPAGAKEKIFRREYYRNSGYGLFLAQEILSITGMTIRESGEPEKGARFVIHVPKEVYRLAKDGDDG